jgi:hypothetical protein
MLAGYEMQAQISNACVYMHICSGVASPGVLLRAVLGPDDAARWLVVLQQAGYTS